MQNKLQRSRCFCRKFDYSGERTCAQLCIATLSWLFKVKFLNLSWNYAFFHFTLENLLIAEINLEGRISLLLTPHLKCRCSETLKFSYYSWRSRTWGLEQGLPFCKCSSDVWGTFQKITCKFHYTVRND